MESSRGVQQGDVLGPALFAIALQPVVERLRELNLELDIGHLDHGLLVGTIHTIRTALSILKVHLPNSGLELNLSECKLFGHGASCVDPAFDGIPRVSFTGSTMVLGVPTGSSELIAKHIDDVCAKLAHLAKRIGLLKFPAVASMLWRLSHQPFAALFAL